MRILRRLTQAAVFLGFLFLFVRARYPLHPAPAPDLLLRASPLGAAFMGLAERGIPWTFWPGMVFLGLTVVLGRFFCGWICPLGTLFDGVGRFLAPKDPALTGSQARSYPKFKVLLLAGLLCTSILGLHLWFFLDPLALLNRGMTTVLYPLATLTVTTVAGLLEGVPGLEMVVRPARLWFKKWIMPETQAAISLVWLTGLIFLGVLATEFWGRRFWCRSVCPAGALLGLCSGWKLLQRRVDDTCVHCGRCSRECRMGAIPAEEVTITAAGECVLCWDCRDHCPAGVRAISFGTGRQVASSPTLPDLRRRELLQTVGLAALITGVDRLDLNNPEDLARFLRPPGARKEAGFLERCIRCLACVRVCASNGGCLQPSGLEGGWRRLWTPRAIMKTGYCEFNCNLCGQVCPTGAIKPLTLVEKKKTLMGLAYFNKNLCIPYAKNTDCLVCEEHCPTSEKAIKIQEKEVLLPNGTTRMVKYPYVVFDQCIGCGICEKKCPLPGEPGVFVIRETGPRG